MDLYVFVKRLWPLLVLAVACVIAGGLTSAVTAHSATRAASWAAAYLVLVAGVATVGLALGRGLLSPVLPAPDRIAVEFGGWFAGNALVMIGTLSPASWLVEVGSVLLVISLVLILVGVRTRPAQGRAGQPGDVVASPARGLRMIRALFLTLVTVLIVSIPIGVMLSHLRR